MNTIKNLISSNVQSQIPDFIVDEYPLFLNFIQTYYQGLERTGESIDLVNNFLNYLDIDFYQNDISSDTTLASNIDSNDTTIQVSSTQGFPDVDGLIQIDSEIILYKSKTSTEFLGCSRGVSGVTKVENFFEYSYSESSSHTQGSTVTNLSYLFLIYFFSKIKSQYLPNFNINFAEGLNVSSFIKTIKSFYNVKGSSQSFDYLIRAFFNTNNQTIYPKDYIISPSNGSFVRRDVVICSSIEGNPLELIGQKILQTPHGADPCSSLSEAAIFYVENAQSKFTSVGELFELTVSNLNNSKELLLPSKTKLIDNLNSISTIITVDSTIGFEKTGYLKIGSELIEYTDKTINQFLNCTRGYCNTTPTSYEVSTEVISFTKCYGTSNIDGSNIEIDILGVSQSLNIENFGRNYFVGDKVTTNNIGFDETSPYTNSWLFNAPKLIAVEEVIANNNLINIKTKTPHGLYIHDVVTIYGFSVSELNGQKTVAAVVNDKQFAFYVDSLSSNNFETLGYVSVSLKKKNNIPLDIINLYRQNSDYIYVASSGYPSHVIGSGITLGNQRYLKKITKTPKVSPNKVKINSGSVGILSNGVLAYSPKSQEKLTYGNITSIDILNGGSGYGLGISGPPSITISNGTGVTATATCNINGSLEKIYVLDGGTGYVKKPEVLISGGGGTGAKAEAFISNGSVVNVAIISSGSGYTSLPSVTISGGGGTGAVVSSVVTGPIQSIGIGNSGNGYTSTPSITINLGDGAKAFPIIDNGKIKDIALVATGSGYNCSPKVFINDSTGKGQGAEIIANLTGDKVTSFTIVNSGINYDQNFTTISIVSRGEGASLKANIKEWSFNLFKTQSLDVNNAIVHFGDNSQFGLEYAYLGNPKRLREQLNDNINLNLTEFLVPTKHSPIIGWAYDGYPIYGPYGYTNPLDFSSGFKRLTSGYSLKTSRQNGPSISDYSLGTFIEDYEYISGDLDEYNGRYCVTPEFPNGTYAYFISIDSSGIPVFPYILGDAFYGIPEDFNLNSESIQDNLPHDILRYRKPYLNIDIDYTRRLANEAPFFFLQEDGVSLITQEDGVSFIESESSVQLYDYFPRQLNKPEISVISTETDTKAKIDGFYIESGGTNYKVNDKLRFTSLDSGYGASAKVSYVDGKTITAITNNQYKKLKYNSLFGNFIAPTEIFGLTSGAGATVSIVDTNNNILFANVYSGNFVSGEMVSLNYSSTLNTTLFSGTGQTIGSGYTSYSLSNSISENDATVTLNVGSGLTIGSNLLINSEIVKVFSGSGNTFNVFRGQFGTQIITHGSGTTVSLIPTVPVTNSSLFEIGNYAKIDNEVFRIVDINNSDNTLSLLRSQLGSSSSSHGTGSTITKVITSTAEIVSISDGYTTTLSTGSSHNLVYNDNIIISSGSTYDFNYIGQNRIISSGNSSFTFETNTLGSGSSSTLSYITSSTTATGAISRIQINSGGSNYKILPFVDVISENGSGASLIPQSLQSGEIKKLSIDNSGFGLTSDYTLKPELEFPYILKLEKTLSIEKIEIVDGGSGYQYVPVVEIIGGGGSGALATAKIINQKVSSIEVVNGGFGYITSPTISIKKSFPCYINTFNSTINLNFNVAGTINTGDIITVNTDGNYPIIYGGLSLSPSLKFYAIVGGGLDANQIQLALTQANANSGNYVELISSGTGNIKIILESANAVARAILSTKDFNYGEIVEQLDNSGNLIARGVVSDIYGWQSSSKTLRVNLTDGHFTNGFTIFGKKSGAKGSVYSVEKASGTINVNSITTTNGIFENETGKISEGSQNIIDSDYYQDYSYILKNEVDFKNWSNSIKNISHPSGFKVFGNRIVFGELIGTGYSEIPAQISVKQDIYNNLSLSYYNDYAISGPDYSTSLKEQVTIYNRELTSSEKIKTSLVDRIDDISNLNINFVGTGTTNIFYLNDRIKTIVKKEDIEILIDDIPQQPSTYNLEFDFENNFNISAAKIVFNTTPKISSNISIICLGLNFDGVNRSFPIYFNGKEKPYNNNQILVSLDGIIQTDTSYDINQDTEIIFSEIPPVNSLINIRKVSSGSTSFKFIGSGISTYTISTGISNNSSLVTIDGVLQNNSAYNIIGNEIIFSENILNNSNVYVRSFSTGISSREVVGVGITTNIIPITSVISSGSSHAIVSIDGIVQDPTVYTVGSGSTCLIFNESISSGSSVYICNFDQKIEKYESIVSNGIISNYIIDNVFNSSPDDFVITVDGVLQTPGENQSFIVQDQLVKNINFVEPPKPRTKFFGLLYNRLDPSTNKIIDDISQPYFVSTGLTGNLVQNDYLQQESNDALCNFKSIDLNNNLIFVNNLTGTFSSGNTIISGLSSAVSTGITTIVTTGSGITVGVNSFSVGSTIGFSLNDYININGEMMKIQNISSGSTFVVSRARVNTEEVYHQPNSIITKIIPASFIISSVYEGFNGTGTTFTLTTDGNPYNYNGTPFSLPSSALDEYGQDYSQSLIATINSIVQDNNTQGSFTLSGSTISFTEPPQSGTNFYGRYIGKLRRLNDISSQFNGIKLSFNLNIGNNLIYSLIPPNSGVDVSNNALIFINGILQNPGEAFSIIGSRIFFSEPPRPNTSFLGYIYIGSDEDVIAKNILQPIEKNDQLLIEGENNYRDVLSVDSSSSVSTYGYFGSINGQNAEAIAIVVGQKITSVIINNGGFGYFDPPTILFQGGGGFGAQGYAEVSNGVITNIVITNPGKNYSSAPKIIFARDLSLYKKERNRREYELTYSKITSLGSGLSFGIGTSLPATNQTIGIANTSGFSSSGIIKIIDNSRNYPVIETITYNSISGTNLTGCVRGVGFNFNKILQLGTGATALSFGLGQTITNGSGATANVIKWDYDNSLLFVNKTSTTDFNNADTLQGTGVTIVDSTFIKTYLSYSAGTTVIQVN